MIFISLTFLRNDKTTALDDYNDDTANKRVTVALACYSTLALRWITAMNRTVVYRTCFLHQMTCRIHPPKSGLYVVGRPIRELVCGLLATAM
jgi:hypothetical protein